MDMLKTMSGGYNQNADSSALWQDLQLESLLGVSKTVNKEISYAATAHQMGQPTSFIPSPHKSTKFPGPVPIPHQFMKSIEEEKKGERVYYVPEQPVKEIPKARPSSGFFLTAAADDDDSVVPPPQMVKKANPPANNFSRRNVRGEAPAAARRQPSGIRAIKPLVLPARKPAQKPSGAVVRGGKKAAPAYPVNGKIKSKATNAKGVKKKSTLNNGDWVENTALNKNGQVKHPKQSRVPLPPLPQRKRDASVDRPKGTDVLPSRMKSRVENALCAQICNDYQRIVKDRIIVTQKTKMKEVPAPAGGISNNRRRKPANTVPGLPAIVAKKQTSVPVGSSGNHSGMAGGTLTRSSRSASTLSKPINNASRRVAGPSTAPASNNVKLPKIEKPKLSSSSSNPAGSTSTDNAVQPNSRVNSRVSLKQKLPRSNIVAPQEKTKEVEPLQLYRKLKKELDEINSKSPSKENVKRNEDENQHPDDLELKPPSEAEAESEWGGFMTQLAESQSPSRSPKKFVPAGIAAASNSNGESRRDLASPEEQETFEPKRSVNKLPVSPISNTAKGDMSVLSSPLKGVLSSPLLTSPIDALVTTPSPVTSSSYIASIQANANAPTNPARSVDSLSAVSKASIDESVALLESPNRKTFVEDDAEMLKATQMLAAHTRKISDRLKAASKYADKYTDILK